MKSFLWRDILPLRGKGTVDCCRNILGTIIFDLCVDIKRLLDIFMSSQILHRLRVHIGINQIGDVGTAQLVCLDLKIHAVDDCIVMGGALIQNRGDGALQLLSVFKITGIGARLGGANRDVLPQARKLRVRANANAIGWPLASLGVANAIVGEFPV